MPSALPPSIIEPPPGSAGGAKPAYVVSQASSSAAHPDDILASCAALREHVARMQADADATLQQLEQRIQARELAEKRRVAPGWLDSEDRLLVPEKKDDAASTGTGMAATAAGAEHGDGSAAQPSEMAAPVPEQFAAGGVTGEALDQAFGSMKIQSS